MLTSIFVFVVALFLVVKGATMATKYAVQIANGFKLSKYTVGFIIVSFISILPETFIAVSSAMSGVPSFALGMLFGSNIADLTLIFALIILITGRGLKVEGKILKNHVIYPFILFLPLLLGLDGYYSRLEGLLLILVGGVFYYISLKHSIDNTVPSVHETRKHKHIFMLLFSMCLLLVGAHFTVSSATTIAEFFEVSPVIIGMLIVGLGTTMPEFFFALKSVTKRDDSLAIGDILGTVLADATIVVGILALVNPFSFPEKIIYISGVFMVATSLILFAFMRSGQTLTKREAYILFIIWLMFICVEFITNS